MLIYNKDHSEFKKPTKKRKFILVKLMEYFLVDPKFAIKINRSKVKKLFRKFCNKFVRLAQSHSQCRHSVLYFLRSINLELLQPQVNTIHHNIIIFYFARNHNKTIYRNQ